jgi:transposase
VSPNKGSISIISAINKNGNLLFNLYDHGKRFKGADIVNFLKELLNHHRNRHVIVVMDQAPCHKAKVVKDFIESQKRLHVFYIPPRTPEFNPEECVWDYLKNKSLKEHKAKTTKDLKNLARSKMRKIASNRKLVRNIFKQSEGANFFL